MKPSSRTNRDPLGEIIRDTFTKPEKDHEGRFTSSAAGPLALAVRQGQASLLGMLANRVMLSIDSDDASLRAVLALTVQSVNYARLAYVALSHGYPIQSLVLVRAFYERIALSLDLRSNPMMAKKLTDNEIEWNDARNFKRRMEIGLPLLYEEYAVLYEEEIPENVVTILKKITSDLYGTLSEYAHPQKDANPWQFRFDESKQRIWFQVGPEKLQTPYSVISLVFLFALQFILATLLLVELADEGGLDWHKVAGKWQDMIRSQTTLVQGEIDKLRIEHMGSGVDVSSVDVSDA